MGVIAAATRELINAGLTGEDLIEAIERLEESCGSMRGSSSKGAARTRRWRENKASQSVTVTSPASQASQETPSLNDGIPSSSRSEFNLNPTPTPPIVPPAPKIAKPDLGGLFDRFWQAYPSRGSATNPKKPARALFDRAVIRGVDPEMLIAAAKRYRATFDGPSTFAMQAERWLRNECWEQYAAPVSPVPAASRKAPSVECPESWDENRWRQELSYARAVNGWRNGLGPPPGSPGCLAPPHLLSDRDANLSRAA